MVCGFRLLSFGLLLVGTGQFRPTTKETVMDRDLLKACISALRELRARKYQELEAGVVVELDAVIAQLESCWSGGGSAGQVPTDTRIRTLNVLAECLKLVTNLSELVRHFFGPE